MKNVLKVVGATVVLSALALFGLSACTTQNTSCIVQQAYVVPLDVPEKGAAPAPPPPAPRAAPAPAPKAPAPAAQPRSASGTTSGSKTTTTTRTSSTVGARTTSTTQTRTYSSTTAVHNYYYTTHFYDNVHYGFSVNPFLPLRPYYIGWGYVGYHPFSTYSYLYGYDAGLIDGQSQGQCGGGF